jgi:hypothetical protein
VITYDTVILDLDFTIWTGCRDKFWSKSLIPPLKCRDLVITDTNGDFIKLDDTIIPFLERLTKNNTNIGFITRGGLLLTKYEEQPPIICLKLFKIFHFFKYDSHVLYKTDLKSEYIKPCGKTLYIDDNNVDLMDISSIKEVDTLNRHHFKNWLELL